MASAIVMSALAGVGVLGVTKWAMGFVKFFEDPKWSAAGLAGVGLVAVFGSRYGLGLGWFPSILVGGFSIAYGAYELYRFFMEKKEKAGGGVSTLPAPAQSTSGIGDVVTEGQATALAPGTQVRSLTTGRTFSVGADETYVGADEAYVGGFPLAQRTISGFPLAVKG